MRRFSVLITLLAATFLIATTINVLVWDDAHTEAVKSLIPVFEKETGIKVNFEMLPSRSVLEKTAIGVSLQKTDYDLVAIDEPFIPQFSELLLPYDEWPEGSKYKKPSLEVVLPEAFRAAEWEGIIRGLPINGNVYVWMARKDLIEKYQNEFKKEYGYDLGFPDTFDQLIDIARFFTKKGIYGFGPFTIKSEGATCEAIFMFESFGTSVLELKDGKYKVVLDKEKAVKAIEFYKELLKYSPPGATAYGHSERIAAFNQGRIFTMFQWPAIIPSHENPDESLVAGKILYGPPPAGPAKRVAIRGCWILAIPKASKNKKAAAEFAYWWASKEMGKKLVKAGMTPVREDLLLDPELRSERPWFVAIFQSMKYAVARPRFEKYPEVSDVIQRYWISAVTGQIAPEEAVDKMVEEIKNVLRKYGY